MEQPYNTPEQDTPVTEQPREKINKALEFLGRSGKCFTEMYEMSLALVETNEKLEQENAQLKELNQSLAERNIYTIQNQAERIAELEAQLIGNSEQLLKEPVYDGNWLYEVIQGFDKNYEFDENLIAVGDGQNYTYLDPKTSATIIVAAIAKHLNPLFEADKNGMWSIAQSELSGKYKTFQFTNYKSSDSLFNSDKAAQKAIDIINQVSPAVLKNYLG